MPDAINTLITILLFYGGFLLAISVHEFAHAWQSDRLGDPTARLIGRMTLNPKAHIDLWGTVLLPLMMLLSGSSFFFGWAKPVEVDAFNLRNPRKDGALISLSGPAANLITATALSLLLRLFPTVTLGSLSFIGFYVEFLIQINVVLAIFNLIPIHPLDGFSVVEGLLSEKNAREWRQLKPYGFIFLIFLVLPLFGTSAPISRVMIPIIDFVLNLLLPGSGVI